MTEDDDTIEEHEGESRSVVGAVVGNSQIGFPVDDIRERLDQGNIGVALLLVMTRAEGVLSKLLRHRYDVAHEPFQKLHGSESLRWYYEKCNTLGLTDSEYKEGMEDLANKRNNIAHDDGYLQVLEHDDEEREEVRTIVEESCEWIESVQIERPSLNPEQDDPTRLDSP